MGNPFEKFMEKKGLGFCFFMLVSLRIPDIFEQLCNKQMNMQRKWNLESAAFQVRKLYYGKVNQFDLQSKLN